MLGRTHALSGVVAGFTAGSLVMHLRPGPLVLLAGLTAAYALAPDLDHCGTTEARSFGFITEMLAWCVEKISGGHRHGTHSLAGMAAFTGTAWLACHFRGTWPGRIALAVVLAAGFAAAADALRKGPAHGENLLGLAGAAAMCWTGYGLALVPLAAMAGTGTHIAGDMLTRCGCPALVACDYAGMSPGAPSAAVHHRQAGRALDSDPAAAGGAGVARLADSGRDPHPPDHPAAG